MNKRDFFRMLGLGTIGAFLIPIRLTKIGTAVIPNVPPQDPFSPASRLLAALQKQLSNISTSHGTLEYNDKQTQASIKQAISGQIERMRVNGQLVGYQFYTVTCDETNNPPSVIDSHRINAEICFVPTAGYRHVFTTSVL